MIVNFKLFRQGGSKYFNDRNPEDSEIQESLNSMKISRQKDAMKQIIASMTIGKDVSKLFPDVVKIIRTKNIELKKLVYLYLINYARIKPDLIFLAVASFHSDAKEGETPLIRGLAVRTMGCIRVPEIVSYLCETLSWCIKDKDPYVRKTAALCVSKLYATSPTIVRENGFIDTLHECLKDDNPIVVANAMTALNEISTLSGVVQLKIKSKNLKNILDSIPKANEWAQVQILNALILYNPKKSSHAEEVIEAVLPRLNHVNQSVVMSAIKVILKFMDLMDDINKVKNYCKKLTNSIMSILISYPEVQYVLLRSLHAIVIKRPMLLEKEFKYFYVQYNDPIYIKLEKVDILYKLSDKKNYEYIIKEFTSYALTETNIELIQKSIKYIGYIGYRIESSLDLCVSCISKIIDNKNEDAIPECIIVARDLMRKYKGTALNLIDKINLELIISLNDPNAKCAALYIIGEFCDKIPTSTEIVSIFVNSFANVEVNSKIKLQILNAAVKNFVTKPDESEELVKICLQKGVEESENPDVRDRAYIYWRLLELDPDIAKEMVCGEKPAFKFNEDDELDVDTIDDMINNMTNVSSCYFKKEKDIINEEDMVVDKEAIAEKEEEEKKEGKKEKKEKKEKKRKKKKKKKDAEEEQINEADLIGLEDYGGVNESISQSDKHNSENNNSQNQQNKQPNISEDIFSIFNNQNANNNQNMNNNNTTNTTGDNNPFGMFDFSDATNNNQVNTNIKTPENIFQNVDQFPTTKVTVSYNQNDLLVCSQFQRNNGQIILGLHISKEGTNCQLNLDKNSFGLICQPNSNISNNVAFFPIKMDKSNSNTQPPSDPFIINGTLNLNGETINMKIEMNIIVLFIENSNLIGNPFVEFYSKNRDHDFNKEIYSYPKYKNEDEVKKIFEKKNILFSARQNKANPPPSYYSGNILGSMPFLIESCLNNDSINIKIIANNEKVAPLIKRAIDSILN
jgi:AP-1 complex subunit beta-1